MPEDEADTGELAYEDGLSAEDGSAGGLAGVLMMLPMLMFF